MAEIGDTATHPDGRKATLTENGWVVNAPQQAAPVQQPSNLMTGKITPQEFTEKTAPMAGLGEGLMTVASGMAAMPVSGLAGLTSLSDPIEAEKRINATRDFMTIPPKSPQGQASLNSIANVAGKVGKAVNYPISGLAGLADLAMGESPQYAGETIKSVQDVGLNKTAGSQALASGSSPLMATAYETLPAAGEMFLGAKGIQSVRPKAQIMEQGGLVPTKDMRVALDKLGLSYDDLTPQAKARMPQEITQPLLGGNAQSNIAKQARIDQMKTGGTSDSLAGLQLIGDDVVTFPAGKEAMKQGFSGGAVRGISSMTPASKEKAREMVTIMQAAKKNERAAMDRFPSDPAGRSVTDRITFIRDKSLDAAKELDRMVKGKDLAYTPINTESVVNSLKASLAKLEIPYPKTAQGKPQLDFSESLISEDPASQRVIQSVLNLMAKGGTPNAAKAHKIKKQLDAMLDFRKKSAGGLTDAGKGVAMDIRRSLNDAIRDVSPEYAKVNDTMYKALTSLDAVNAGTGKLDIFGENAASQLGVSVRKLMSNYASRQELVNALESLDNVSAQLGGNFTDNVKDLAFMADILDDRFGTIKKNSLAGIMNKAAERTVEQGLYSTAKTQAAKAAGAVADKAQGISDYNAYESLLELLKE